MAVNNVATNGLSGDVSRASLAGPLSQGEVPRANALLRPRLTHCQVPDSPNASAAAYSNGRAAVRADLQGRSETE
eukprot:15475931-Alexandrium_andersonii.AAC.1